MMPLSRSRLEFIATILQNVLNLGLLTLGLILVVFSVKRRCTWRMPYSCLSKPANMNWWKGW